MCPPGPSTSSSTRLARPSQILLTTDVPLNSTHWVEPHKGCTRRRRCVLQAPISKSKSCCPSRMPVSAGAMWLAVTEFACDSPSEPERSSEKQARRRVELIFCPGDLKAEFRPCPGLRLGP